jgi:hypothetical protein
LLPRLSRQHNRRLQYGAPLRYPPGDRGRMGLARRCGPLRRPALDQAVHAVAEAIETVHDALLELVEHGDRDDLAGDLFPEGGKLISQDDAALAFNADRGDALLAFVAHDLDDPEHGADANQHGRPDDLENVIPLRDASVHPQQPFVCPNSLCDPTCTANGRSFLTMKSLVCAQGVCFSHPSQTLAAGGVEHPAKSGAQASIISAIDLRIGLAPVA